MIDQDFLEVKKENKNNPNKNIIIITVLVLILLIGGFFVFKNKITQKSKVDFSEVDFEEKLWKQVPTNLPQGMAITKPEKVGGMPQGFPEIPLRGNEKEITQNAYTIHYADGREQKVIDFVSSKPVKENIDFYRGWLRDNGWQEASFSQYSNGAIMSAFNERNNIIIDISQDKNNPDKNSKVNINVS